MLIVYHITSIFNNNKSYTLNVMNASPDTIMVLHLLGDTVMHMHSTDQMFNS